MRLTRGVGSFSPQRPAQVLKLVDKQMRGAPFQHPAFHPSHHMTQKPVSGRRTQGAGGLGKVCLPERFTRTTSGCQRLCLISTPYRASASGIMDQIVQGRCSDWNQRLNHNQHTTANVCRTNQHAIFMMNSNVVFYECCVYVDALAALVVTMSISREPLRDTLHIMFRCLTNQ